MDLSIRRLAVLGCAGLCACAPVKADRIPSLQAFDNYRQLLRFDLIAAVDAAPEWQAVPAELRRKLALCTAELALSDVTPERLNGLDAYARDPRKLPLDLRHETLTLEDAAMAKSLNGDLANLQPFCKDDAEALRKYAG